MGVCRNRVGSAQSVFFSLLNLKGCYKREERKARDLDNSSTTPARRNTSKPSYFWKTPPFESSSKKHINFSLEKKCQNFHHHGVDFTVKKKFQAFFKSFGISLISSTISCSFSTLPVTIFQRSIKKEFCYHPKSVQKLLSIIQHGILR